MVGVPPKVDDVQVKEVPLHRGQLADMMSPPAPNIAVLAILQKILGSRALRRLGPGHGDDRW